MILINELRVSSDNKHLLIDVLIEDIEKYDSVTIKSISFDTQDTFKSVEKSDSHTVIYDKETYVPTPENPIIVYNEGKRIVANITSPLIDTSKNNLYIVYFEADALEAEMLNSNNWNCSIDKSYVISSTVNLCNIYKSFMANIKELASNCDLSKNFIDKYLRFLAIESSIRTGNYTSAVEYWKKFFLKDNIKETKSCKCNE